MKFPSMSVAPFQNRYFRAASVKLAIIAFSFGLTPSSGQTMVMQEPDFSGLFQVEGVSAAPVLLDAARGWTYFAGGGNVEGVAFSQLFRISDAGIADVRWRVPSDFQIIERYLAPDGTPIVRAFVKNSPTYETRWYRLERESVGQIVPAEIPSSAQLPPRDSINLFENAGAVRRLLPQRDGTTIALETSFTPEPLRTVTFTLRKLDARNNELWSTVIGDGQPHNFSTDASGNVYVLGEAVSVKGKKANLLRVLANGQVDTAWNPDIEYAENVSTTMRVVSDRIVLADLIKNSVSGSVRRLTTFDLITGIKLTQRYPQRGFSGAFSGIAEDGTVMAADVDGHWQLLDPRRNEASGDRVSAARVGSSAQITTAARWKEGYVLGGNFLYWFDGKLYRNLMRVDASFRPDPTWTPSIEGSVAALAVDVQGRLIVGSNSAFGREARLARFNADDTLDSGWNPVVTGSVYKILPTSDGMLIVGGAFSAINGVSRGSLARFRADGTLDRDWASQPSWPVMSSNTGGQFGRDGIYSILDAGADGVYFVWEDGHMNGAESGVVRLSREGVGAKLSVPEGAGFGMRDPATGVIYGIGDAWGLTSGTERGTALIRLLPPSMAVDRAWTTYAKEYGRQFAGFAYQTNEHIYVCRGQNVWLGIELRRFDKVTGKEDPDWRSDETYLCYANSFERGTNGTTLTLSSQYAGPPTRYSSTARNEPRTVVEYYSRAAKRFFMTGRPNEIDLLDAQTASFTRTGMQFSAETATVRSNDTTRTPICRFYAAPEAGGSNTHFYGRESDCTMLKRFQTLRYEGYDFRAGLPGSNGTCTSTLPQPVYRLFNQATAGNNGNHRYVVSDSRKNEMIAAGWVAEGVAFCTSSATDSRPLAEITQ